MIYLEAFLAKRAAIFGAANARPEEPPLTTDKSAERPSPPLQSVLAVARCDAPKAPFAPQGRKAEERAPAACGGAPSIERREPCDDCGRTDWIVSVCTDYGGRFCRDCIRPKTATPPRQPVEHTERERRPDLLSVLAAAVPRSSEPESPAQSSGPERKMTHEADTGPHTAAIANPPDRVGT